MDAVNKDSTWRENKLQKKNGVNLLDFNLLPSPEEAMLARLFSNVLRCLCQGISS